MVNRSVRVSVPTRTVSFGPATGSQPSSSRVRLLQPAAPPWWRYALPSLPVITLWRNRRLIWQLAIRDLRSRYQGSFLGLLWSFVTPCLMLLAYTFVFRYVFQARWGTSPQETGIEFALTLFAGLLTYMAFSESVTRSPTAIVAQPNLVKKVVFPLEALPAAQVVGAAVHIGVALAMVWIVNACLVRPPGWSLLWLPVIVIPYLWLLLGLAWVLASLGTFLRDLGPGVAIVTQVLIFLSPVFYPLTSVPARWRWLFELNPLATYVESIRCVLLWDRVPDGLGLATTAILSWLVFQWGFICFMKCKRAFADVL